jgi:hypothetical protein
MDYSQNETALAKINFEIIRELIVDDSDETFKKPSAITHEALLSHKARIYEPKKNIIR